MLIPKNIYFFTLICCLGVVFTFSAPAQWGGSAGNTQGLDPFGQQDISSALDRLNTNSVAEDASATSLDGYYIGRAVGANILKQYKPYTRNPALTEYLNKICSGITVNSPKPEIYNGYHLVILDTEEINAFASSGGHIFVTLGLIKLATSEDMLAAVIAHEVAHIQLEHALGIIDEMKVYSSLRATADRAEAIASRGMSEEERKLLFNSSINQIVETLLKNGFSQEQEFQADTQALSLLASAGYNPNSLIDMIRILGNNTRQSGGIKSTHPSPSMRINNLQRTVRNFRVTDTTRYRVNRFKQFTRL
ncbi:MAG: M48 family metalloprotease [Treponema sp.]|jgi:predicted Zn-dependent protease|nr:M48 family metalloprotease [Treponema sp.]